MQSDVRTYAFEDCLDALIDYRGKTPRKAAAGIPLVTAKVVKSGRIEAPNEFISADDFGPWMTRGLPRVGDVVMTTEAPLGEVGQIQCLPVALAQRIVTLRGKKGLLDSDYLLYLMQSEPFQAQLRGRASGTTVVGIKQSELRKVTVELPPIQEQVQVASTLKSLDDRIDLLRQTNATLEAIAQALFKSWFVDFDPVRAKAEGREPEGMDAATAALFPSEFEKSELGLIPKGWRAGTLGDLSELNASKWTTKQRPDWISYIDLSGVSKNRTAPPMEYRFDDAPSRARHHLRDGDTIIGTVRPGNRAFAFISEPASTLTGSTGFAVLSPKSPDLSSFVYLAATRDEAIERLANLADGGAYPAVRPSIVAATPCVGPQPGVRKAFSEIAQPLLNRIARNESNARTLSEIRDTLLPRLISGNLRLPEAKKSIEEVVA